MGFGERGACYILVHLKSYYMLELSTSFFSFFLVWFLGSTYDCTALVLSLEHWKLVWGGQGLLPDWRIIRALRDFHHKFIPIG